MVGKECQPDFFKETLLVRLCTRVCSIQKALVGAYQIFVLIQPFNMQIAIYAFSSEVDSLCYRTSYEQIQICDFLTQGKRRLVLTIRSLKSLVSLSTEMGTTSKYWLLETTERPATLILGGRTQTFMLRESFHLQARFRKRSLL